jgi:hypothetical protein
MEEAITALLAGVASGRRFWVRAPQSAARPFLVLNRVSGVRDYTYQGPSGFVQSRVQVDVYADTYPAAKATARAVRDALSGHSGGSIQGIFYDNERDLPAADAGEATHLFRTSLDFTISHTETT